MTEYQTRARQTPKGVEEEMNQKEKTGVERDKYIHKLLKASKNLFR